MSTTVATKRKKPRPVIGWREWVALPDLHIKRIKAKLDTGARSAALHAFNVEVHNRHGTPWVRFMVHPLQKNTKKTIVAEAKLLGYRAVRSSSGHEEKRPVIVTNLLLANQEWPVEITLTKRDMMGFRFLIGRKAIRRHFVIDPRASFLAGRPKGVSL